MEESSHARGEVGAWQTDMNGNVGTVYMQGMQVEGWKLRNVIFDLRPDGTVRWRFSPV